MKVQIRVERNVSECVTIEVKDLEHLKQLVKDNTLFDFIDEQNERFEDGAADEVWEEVCGEILWTNIAILNDDNTDQAEYRISDENELLKLNQYGEVEEDVMGN